MKRKSDGDEIRVYLKENKINQTDLAAKMGLSRQGLIWHLSKDRVDHEFKMKLREAGVKMFDEAGNVSSDSDKDDQTYKGYRLPMTEAEIIELQKKLIAQYENEMTFLRNEITSLKSALAKYENK